MLFFLFFFGFWFLVFCLGILGPRDKGGSRGDSVAR